ncbi:MAG TPA: type VI secretion system protein TssA, partial [Marinagarivorans sp.]|nr:type VI secretion system protein TssA [Marinagarivorans sp.]
TSRILDDKSREKEYARKGYTLQNIETAVRESSSDFLTDLRNDLVGALDSFTRFNDKLYQLCGASEAPPSSAITNLLKDCITAVTFLGGNKIVAETSTVDDSLNAAQESDHSDNAAAGAGAAAVQPVTRALANRDQAFKQLAEIAEFFRKTEPHSPISYMLEKAVRWGNMPLHELMQELISDDATRNRYSELTGVKGQ